MADIGSLIEDLRAENADLDGLVAHLDTAALATPTPAPGWSIAHQLAHLAWTDRWSLLAVQEPEGFEAAVRREFTDGFNAVERGAAEGVDDPAEKLLGRWRDGREQLLTALGAAPADTRLPWFGPPMKPASMVTARLMETWAHGQDVADALGVDRVATDRLRHVAHLGIRTMGFAFAAHGLPAPEALVRVELRSPDGELWSWGPEDADDRVTGPALDFCLLATQRRHRDDLELSAVGPVAKAWLPIVQAFAGPPGPGREPRS